MQYVFEWNMILVGPFDSEDAAQVYADSKDLEKYRLIPLWSPNPH